MPQNTSKKKVAVKVFLHNMTDLDGLTVAELLERSKNPGHLLHAYKYDNTDSLLLEYNLCG